MQNAEMGRRYERGERGERARDDRDNEGENDDRQTDNRSARVCRIEGNSPRGHAS